MQEWLTKLAFIKFIDLLLTSPKVDLRKIILALHYLFIIF